jgi:hypothetical protein
MKLNKNTKQGASGALIFLARFHIRARFYGLEHIINKYKIMIRFKEDDNYYHEKVICEYCKYEITVKKGFWYIQCPCCEERIVIENRLKY